MSDLLCGIPLRVNTKIKCKKCGNDLTKARYFQGFYGCEKCNAWTKNAEIVQKPYAEVLDNLISAKARGE
jgi:ribosomal protein L37AE/L43A